jgi:xylulokinase
VLTSIGTSGQVFAVTARPVIDPQGRIHSLCHVVPDRWHVMGAILAGGLALRWLRDILTPPGDPPPEYDALTAEAAPIPAGADGLIFLPYLQGERTPHMDPQARGVFFGLRSDHTRAHLVRAVMEGVVFALRDGLEVFRALGIAPAEMRVAGGGARSPLWRQIQRDVFELPVCATAADHGAAYGAALLAAVGAGAFATAADAARAVPLGARSAPARTRSPPMTRSTGATGACTPRCGPSSPPIRGDLRARRTGRHRSGGCLSNGTIGLAQVPRTCWDSAR